MSYDVEEVTDKENDTTKLSSAAFYDGEKDPKYTIGFRANAVATKSVYSDPNSDDYDELIVTNKATGTFTISGTNVTANITEGRKLSETHYYLANDDTYGTLDEREMIDYALSYDSNLNTVSRTDYYYKAGSAEDLDWTVSYDVFDVQDKITSTSKLSSAVYYGGDRDPQFTLGFRAGVITSKSVNEDKNSDDYDDLVTTHKASGTFAIDGMVVTADFTEGRLVSKTYYYLYNDDTYGALDEREMMDYAVSYNEEEIITTRTDYYYKSGSGEDLDWTVSYDVEDLAEADKLTSTDKTSNSAYYGGERDPQYTLSFRGGAVASKSIYSDPNGDDYDELITTYKATGTFIITDMVITANITDGRLLSETHYYLANDDTYGMRDEREMIDYTTGYNEKGNITTRTDYYYYETSAEELDWTVGYNVEGLNAEDQVTSTAKLSSAAYYGGEKDPQYTIGFKAGVVTSKSIYDDSNDDDYDDIITTYKATGSFSIAGMSVTADINPGRKLSMTVYYFDNNDTYGALDEREMIDYAFNYDENETVTTRTDYYYKSGSGEDLDWTVSYDVEHVADKIGSTDRLSSAAFYNGENNPEYTIGFRGGAVASKSVYEDTNSDGYDDLITTNKASGTFTISGMVITPNLTIGRMLSKTYYYLTNNDTYGDRDEREMIDCAISYDEVGVITTRTDYYYKSDSVEDLDWTVSYDVENVNEPDKMISTDKLSSAVYYGGKSDPQYTIGFKGGAIATKSVYTDTNSDDYDDLIVSRKATGTFTIADMVITADIIEGRKLSETYYYLANDDTYGTLEEREMIDYALSFAEDGTTITTRTDYYYKSGSAEDLDWTVSYDVEKASDKEHDTTKLSSAAFYGGKRDPQYTVGFRGGAVASKSVYEDTNTDDFDDLITTHKATGTFNISGTTITAVIDEGRLLSKTYYYLVNGNIYGTLDEREMIDYVMGYAEDGIAIATRADYYYKAGSAEDLDWTVSYDVKGMTEGDQITSTAKLSSAAYYGGERNPDYTIGFKAGAAASKSVYADTNSDDYDDLITTNKASGTLTISGMTVTANITVGRLLTETYYYLENNTIYGDLDEREMIDYAITYDNHGVVTSRTDYFYLTGSAEDLDWTVSYDVEGLSAAEQVTSTAKLSTAAYYAGKNNPEYTIGFKGGTVTSKSVYKDTNSDDYDDFITTNKATGTFSVSGMTITADITEGRLLSKTYYYLTNDDTYGALDEREMMDYVMSYDENGVITTRTDYYYQQDSGEDLEWTVTYDVEGLSEQEQITYSANRSNVAYYGGERDPQYTIGFRGGEIATKSVYEDTNDDDYDDVLTTKKASGIFTITGTTITASITEDKLLSKTYYYLTNNTTYGDMDEREMISYVINYKGEAGNEHESALNQYFYQSNTTEKIDKILQYKVVNSADVNIATKEVNISDDLKRGVSYYTADGKRVSFAIQYGGNVVGDEEEAGLTIYNYGTDNKTLVTTKRYAIKDTADVLDIDTPSLRAISITDDLLRTITYYYGAAGSEIANYAENYRGNGTTIVNKTYYYYGTGEGVRAQFAKPATDAMVKNETVKYDSKSNEKVSSVSYYTGVKDEEVLSVSYSCAYDENERIGEFVSATHYYYAEGNEELTYTLTYNIKGDIADNTSDDKYLVSKTIYEFSDTYQAYTGRTSRVIGLRKGEVVSISKYEYAAPFSYNNPDCELVVSVSQNYASGTIDKLSPDGDNITEGLKISKTFQKEDDPETPGVYEAEQIDYIVYYDRAASVSLQSEVLKDYYHYEGAKIDYVEKRSVADDRFASKTTYTGEEGWEKVLTVEDRRGKISTYYYTTEGYIDKIVSNDGSVVTYFLSEWGTEDILKVTDNRGGVSTYTYNTTTGYIDNVVRKVGDNVVSTTYYEVNSAFKEERVKEVKTRKEVTITYEYDPITGNLIRTSNGNGLGETKFRKNKFYEDQAYESYDETGQEKTVYEYDIDDALIKTTTSRELGRINEDGTVTPVVSEDYTVYMKNSRFEDVVHYVISGNNIVTVYYYNELGDMEKSIQIEEADKDLIKALTEGTKTIDEFITELGTSAKKSISVYELDDYNESRVAHQSIWNGAVVYYNYEEVADPTYIDEDLRFRTIVTRTVYPTDYSTYDSIIINNRFDQPAFVIDSRGVVQYTSIAPIEDGGADLTKKVTATNVVYYYDVDGRLVRIEQDEMTPYEVDNVVYYTPVRVIYTYQYDFDETTGKVLKATAIGKYAENPNITIKKQIFDSEMRLLELWEMKRDQSGIYLAQTFEYFDLPGNVRVISSLINALVGSASEAVVRLGSEIVKVDGNTKIYDISGQEISWSDLKSVFMAAPNDTYLKIKAYKDKDTGEWIAQRLQLIEKPVQYVSGSVDNLFNPNGLSILNGVVQDINIAGKTITFDGKEINIADTTIIKDMAGNIISLEQLEKFINEQKAQDLLVSINLITMPGAGNTWTAQFIKVKTGGYEMGQTVLTSVISNFDQDNNVVTFCGRDVLLDEATAIVDINGFTMTKQQLADILDENPRITIKMTRSGVLWKASTIIVFAESMMADYRRGSVNDVWVDPSDPQGLSGTITINGEVITITGETSILDQNGKPISLAKLRIIFAENEGAGIIMTVRVAIDGDGNALKVEITSRFNNVVTTFSEINSITTYTVGDYSAKLTLASLMDVWIANDTSILLNGREAITLAQLKDLIEGNNSSSISTYALIKVEQYNDLWFAKEINITTNDLVEYNIYSIINDALVSGADNIIETDGLDLKVNADTIIKDKDGNEITFDDLVNIIATFRNSDTKVFAQVIMEKSGSDWIAKEVLLRRNLATDTTRLAAVITRNDIASNGSYIMIDSRKIYVNTDTYLYLYGTNNAMYTDLLEYMSVIGSQEVYFTIQARYEDGRWYAQDVYAFADYFSRASKGKVTGFTEGTNSGTISLNGKSISINSNTKLLRDGKEITLEEFFATLDFYRDTYSKDPLVSVLYVKDGSDNLAIEVKLQIPQSKGYVKGQLSAVDVFEQTLTIGNQSVWISTTCYIYVDNVRVTNLDALKAKLQEASNNGWEVNLDSYTAMEFTPDGWKIGTDQVAFYTKKVASGLSGILSSVDAANNRLVIAGIEISFTATSLIKLDNVTLASLTELQSKLTDAINNGWDILSSSVMVNQTANGWVTAGVLLFTTSKQTVNVTNIITEIDVGLEKITIGDKIVDLSEDYRVFLDNAQYSLSDFLEKYNEAVANGWVVEVTTGIAKTESGWVFTDRDIKFTTIYSTCKIAGKIEGVDNENRTITVGNTVVMLPDQIKLDGVFITKEEFYERFRNAMASGSVIELTTVDIKGTKDGWVLVPSMIILTTGGIVHSITGAISEVRVAENKILIGGVEIIIPDDYTIYVDGNPLAPGVTGLQDLASWVDTAIQNGWRIETYYSYNIALTTDGWKFTGVQDKSIRFTRYISSGTLTGVITRVDTANSLVYVNNQPINIANHNISLGGTYISIERLASLLEDAARNGYFIEIYPSITILSNDSEWTLLNTANFTLTTVKQNYYIDVGTRLDSIDAVNRKMTIAGQVLYLPADYNIYADGKLVSIDELASLLEDAALYHWNVKTTGTGLNITVDVDGHKIANLQKGINFMVEKANATIAGLIGGVDAVNKKVIIGGLEISLDNITTILIDNKSSTFDINTFKALFDNIVAGGGCLELKAMKVKNSGDKWLFDSSSLNVSTYAKGATISGIVGEAIANNPSYGGENTIKIGGEIIIVPDTCILNINGAAATFEELVTKLAEANAQGYKLEISDIFIGKEGDDWIVKNETLNVNYSIPATSISGVVSSINIEGNSIRLGDMEIIIPQNSLIYLDGTSMSLSELKDRFDILSAAGMGIDVDENVAIKYVVNHYEFNTDAVNFITASPNSSIGGYIYSIDRQGRKVTIGGVEFYIPNDFIITYSLNGSYYGSQVTFSELCDRFDELRQNGFILELQNNENVKKTTGGWLFSDTQKNIAFTAYNPTESIDIRYGTALSCDIENGNISVGNKNVHLQDAYTIYLDNEEMTLSEFNEKILEAISIGESVQLYNNSQIINVNEQWTFKESKVYFITKSVTATIKGAIGSINTTGHTLTIGDITVNIPDNLVFLIDNVTVAGIDELAQKLEAIKALGGTLEIISGYDSVYKTANGWVLKGQNNKVLFESKIIDSTINGFISNVDTVNKIISIGGIDIKIPDGFYIKLDGKDITDINELKARIEEIESLGGMVSISSNIKKTIEGWVFVNNSKRVDFTSLAFTSSIDGALGGIDISSNTITIGNITFIVPAGFDIYLDSAPLTDLVGLKAKFEDAATLGGALVLTSAVSFKKTPNGFELYSNSQKIYFTTKLPTATLIGTIDSVDLVNSIIKVGGVSIYVPEDLVIKLDGNSITLEEFASKLAQAKAVGGNLEIESNGNVILDSSTRWVFNSSNKTIYFTTRIPDSQISGKIDSIDTEKKTITIGGLAIELPQELAIYVDNKVCNDMLGLVNFLTEMKSAGGSVDISSSNSSVIYKTQTGWAFRGYNGRIYFETKPPSSTVVGNIEFIDTANGKITIGGQAISVGELNIIFVDIE
ncbi:MAG: hypothetical protein COS99_06715, partial [Candidatus Omnitrophica bacterium CG07_land_8_20_14_0_80_42_15]